MELVINSVWFLAGIDGITKGTYRILDVSIDEGIVIVFHLRPDSRLIRPDVIFINELAEASKQKKAYISIFPLPPHQLMDDSFIPEKHRLRRDNKYALVSVVLRHVNFLRDFVANRHSPILAIVAKQWSTTVITLYRSLNAFWRYGQDRNALLPFYVNSGAKGKSRRVNEVPLGAPRSSLTGTMTITTNYRLGEIDKDNFRKGLKKYYLKVAGKSLKDTYQCILRQYYKSEIQRSSIENEPPHVPTLRQFLYWRNKLFSKDTFIRKRSTPRDYMQNKRALMGGRFRSVLSPGSYFEIDATVADVHIVSELQRNHVLGRPTVYTVVDRASRMIVGLHVSLLYASWEAARQALANTFLPKAAFCQKFGIDIVEADWPCAHIPQRLFCDNGEMIGLAPNEYVVPFTQLEFAPSYRPDFKGIVEKRFDILNKNLLHGLVGTTRGGKFIRGEPDPRDKAIFTLKEVTALLIQTVLEHNRSRFDALVYSSRLLITHNLSPTPLHFWQIHLQQHHHALKQAGKEEILARLLPADTATMTRHGLRYNNLYYSCLRIVDEGWVSQARVNGRWSVDIRADKETTNYIYARLGDKEGFTRCELLARSREYGDLPVIETLFLQDWLKAQRGLQPVTVESINAQRHRHMVEQQAKKLADEAQADGGKKRQYRDIRSRRRQEMYLHAQKQPMLEPSSSEKSQLPQQDEYLPSSHRNKEQNS